MSGEMIISLGRRPGEGHSFIFDDLYWEASSERGTFFRLQVYERVAIHEFKHVEEGWNL